MGIECSCTCLLFFFFQAEDGIRDLTVTGVQTCALPISSLGPLTTPTSGSLAACKSATACASVLVQKSSSIVESLRSFVRSKRHSQYREIGRASCRERV